jgi:hypothetical protein
MKFLKPRRKVKKLTAAHLGAQLSLTLVAWDDESPAPPAFLHLPLLPLTWLLALLLSLRANTRRAGREVRWGWQRFLRRCEDFYNTVELYKIFGRAFLYGLGVA